MKTQSINRTICIFDLFSLVPEISTPPRWETTPEPDRKFYDDEAELAEELYAPLPVGMIIQRPPEIDPDEFEARYQWFLA